MQVSIGIVQIKYVAVTVLLVSDFLPEAADPWRFCPHRLTEAILRIVAGVNKIL
jgi:hypothetical protein